jgi:hypothetical protein
MKRFISQGTIISLCLFALATIRAHELDKQPPPIASASQAIPKKPETRVPFEEKLLGTMPPEYENPPDITGSTVFLDNPAQWGFVARQNGKLFVVINNKKGQEFDEIRFLFQSPDRSTIGYVAEESHAAGRKTFLVLGSKTIPLQQGESIDLGETNHLLGARLSLLSPPVFSLDSKKVAYISFREDKKKEAVAILEGDWNDSVRSPPSSAPNLTGYGNQFLAQTDPPSRMQPANPRKKFIGVESRPIGGRSSSLAIRRGRILSASVFLYSTLPEPCSLIKRASLVKSGTPGRSLSLEIK